MSPYLSKKKCNYPGCSSTIEHKQRHCKEHRQDTKKTTTKRWTNEETNVYANDWNWRKLSHTYRTINPLCEICLKQGKTTAAKVTDHKIPLSQGGDKYDWENLQSLCRRHHRIKTVRDRESAKG